MSYELLYQELSKYPTLTDDEIAAALNVETVVRKLAKTDDIIALSYNIGLYPQLVAISIDDQYPVALRAMAKSLIDLNLGTIPEIDPFAPASVVMLDSLLTANLITEEQRGMFEALGIASRSSRAAQLGFTTVTAEDIQAAREWHEAQAVIEAVRVRLQSAYNTAMGRLGEMPPPEWSDILGIFEAA